MYSEEDIVLTGYPRFTKAEYEELVFRLIADELTGVKATILERAQRLAALYRSGGEYWTVWTLEDRGGDGTGKTCMCQCEDLELAFVALHYGYNAWYKFSGARREWFAYELPR